MKQDVLRSQVNLPGKHSLQQIFGNISAVDTHFSWLVKSKWHGGLHCPNHCDSCFLQDPVVVLKDRSLGVSCVGKTQPCGPRSLFLSQLHLDCQLLPTWREAQPLEMGSVNVSVVQRHFFLILSQFLIRHKRKSSPNRRKWCVMTLSKAL